MATNSFYNQTKKRAPLTLIHENAKKISLNNDRVPLIKLAHATRTFWTQAEALQYMAERQTNERNLFTGEILYLFTFQSQPGGTRRYQVADIDIFIHEYYQLPAHQRHTYEIIIDKKPSKLYFDLEFDIRANPTLDGLRLTMNFVQFVLNFMRNRSDDLDYSIEDVLILDSTSAVKFSRHLIFQTKDPFPDNLAVGRFVQLILEDIHGCLVNHQCSSMTQSSLPFSSSSLIQSDSTVYAKYLLNSLQPYLARFENCHCLDDYSQLSYRDLIQFIVKKNDDQGFAWFCDTGVYTKNRAFRLLRSSKFEKQECFQVAPENRWKPKVQRSWCVSKHGPSDNERQTFLASLVYFNQPIRRFIDVDGQPNLDQQPAPPLPAPSRQVSSTLVSDDLSRITSYYPELIQFMSNVAREKPEAGDHQIIYSEKCRSSQIYKGKEQQNEYRWEINLMYSGDYKYCERIQRHHRSNNIYFVVDMRGGTYRQKCHDSDCRDFEGEKRPLPSNVTPWLTVLNTAWDDQEKNLSPTRSMQETL